MTEARERIELRHDGYLRTTLLASKGGDEGRLHSCHPTLHGESPVLQAVGEQRRCNSLLESELRVGMDLQAGGSQLWSQLVDLLSDSLLQGRCTHGTASQFSPGAPARLCGSSKCGNMTENPFRRRPHHNTPSRSDCQRFGSLSKGH